MQCKNHLSAQLSWVNKHAFPKVAVLQGEVRRKVIVSETYHPSGHGGWKPISLAFATTYSSFTVVNVNRLLHPLNLAFSTRFLTR